MVELNKRLTTPDVFRSYNPETLAEAQRRGLLVIDKKTKIWRYGDSNNGVKRSLRDRRFKRAERKGHDWHNLIGLEDTVSKNRYTVFLVLEGATDALAAFELSRTLGILQEVGIVAALGAGYRPRDAELQQLAGRKVILIGDRDPAGLKCIELVSAALVEHKVEHHVVLVWPEPAKDLAGLIELHAKQKADLAPIIYALNKFFSSPFPSNHSTTTQPFNCSTTQLLNPSTQESGSVEKESFNGPTEENGGRSDFVAAFVVTKKGTGNTWSFNLARALINRDGNALSDETIRAALHEWFVRSRPMLPADADEEKTLRKFYGQLRRVRFTTAGLYAACERASTLPLPDIPGLPANYLKVAALNRELQRDAGDRPYICPVNKITGFLQLKYPEQANWIQHQLEKADVIHCVGRGEPHRQGRRGKSTLWRYLRPL